jgi:hypothetical protein
MTNPSLDDVRSAKEYWEGRLRGMQTDKFAVDIVAIEKLNIILRVIKSYLEVSGELPKEIPEIEIPPLDTVDFTPEQRQRILQYLELTSRSRFAHGQNVAIADCRLAYLKQAKRVEYLEKENKRLSDCHEAELGVCQQHCEFAQVKAGVSEGEISGALARGYCSKENANKILDPNLIMAMQKEISNLLHGQNTKGGE